MINAVAAASEKFGKADRRPVMIHAQTAREDQIDRMIEEGIVPSYFVAHTFYWGDWHRDSVFGVERASRISPLRSSTDKGLRHTIHNDTPVVPANMMRLLWTAVNRITRSGKVLGEAQRATVMEGIKAMTLDGAYQFFEEDSKGSIEAGKRADLVILDKNPMKVDPIDIKDIAILETIKDGETVFKM
jgi:predicted amidohydrolase YtcJ